MCRIMDNKSSLIPICLILTSGASLRASLSLFEEKPSSPLFFTFLSNPLCTLDLSNCFIVSNFFYHVAISLLRIVTRECSAMRTRCHKYLLVVYIVTVLLHRPLICRYPLLSPLPSPIQVYLYCKVCLTLLSFFFFPFPPKKM